VLDYRLSDEGSLLLERLFKTMPALDKLFEVGVGINTGFIRDELVSDSRVDQRYHPLVTGTGISRYGEVRTTGWIMYDPEYIRSRGDRGRSLPAERLFSRPKVLVVRTRNLSLACRIVATVDETQAYNLNRLSNIVVRDDAREANLYGLLGMLNSRFFNWLFNTRFYDYEVKPVYLKTCPVADTGDETLVRLVTQLIATNTTKASPSMPARVDALEQAINTRVEKLFGLSEDESALVERESAQWSKK
jgi:hypothetical protein